MQIKDATKADAADLAYLINLAGEGIPEYLWSQMAEQHETPQQVGIRRVKAEGIAFSYNNARVCCVDNKPAGMMISYRLDEPYDLSDLDEYPAIVRPLVELEAAAPGSWYINAVATYEKYRGKGIAGKLIADAELLGKRQKCDRLSLIVASENVGAKRLYEHLGFRELDSRAVIEYPGCLHGGNWVLMTIAL